MRFFQLSVTVVLSGGLAFAAGQESATQTVELRVLSSNGVKAVLEMVQPVMEQAIGRDLSIEFSTSASLKTRIEGGEAFDIAILTPSLIDALVTQGLIIADSRVTFARTGVGVGAHERAPVADVSTVEALKGTLLGASSVAMTADGQSRRISDSTFERLGIVDAMRPKIILVGPGAGPHSVAAGEVELVLTLVSEIVSVPGVQLLGPFPDEVQGYISFTAGQHPSATDTEAASDLLRFLGDPSVAAAAAANGMETMEQ
jgi:molybdate transport system substrate-binding protein